MADWVMFMVALNKIDIVHRIIWPDDTRIFDPRDFEEYRIVVMPGRLMPNCEARDLLTYSLEKFLRKGDMVIAMRLLTYLTHSPLKVRPRYDLVKNIYDAGKKLHDDTPEERENRGRRRYVGAFTFNNPTIIPESVDNLVDWIRHLEGGLFERADGFLIEACVSPRFMAKEDRPEWARELE